MNKTLFSRGRLAQWKTVRFVIFVQGDCGSNLAEDFSFQTRSFVSFCFEFFAQMFDGNLQHWMSYINLTQPRSKAVATSLLSEEERSLGNWSYDVMSWTWRHIIYYAILQYILQKSIQATCGGISKGLTIRRRQEMTEEQCHRPKRREKWRKRITGWLAGHTIHLETEEVTWIKFKSRQKNVNVKCWIK